MTSRVSVASSSIRSAFPWVYGIAFIITLAHAFTEFRVTGLPPHIKNALIMPADQNAAWTSLSVFAFAVSFYVFVLYIRLELFEHRPLLPKFPQMTPSWRRIEFALRVVIVGLITLKLTRWTDFSSLLVFHLMLTFLFCLWMFHLRPAANPSPLIRALTYAALPIFTCLLIFFERGQISAVITLQFILFPIIITIAIAGLETYEVIMLMRSHLSEYLNTN